MNPAMLERMKHEIIDYFRAMGYDSESDSGDSDFQIM